MSFTRKIKTAFNQFLDQLKQITDAIVLPGFSGLSLFKVGKHFWISLSKGAVDIRAGAIAYSFFLAVFPSILFLFSLIPYIPVEGFQTELMNLLESVMPQKIFSIVESTVLDIASNKRGSLLSFGFLAALIFSTNGVNTLIRTFNETVNDFETRNWLERRAISILIVFIMSLLISIAIGLIIFSEKIMNMLVSEGFLTDNFTIIILELGRWIVIVALFYFAVSFVYYLAPSRKAKFKFFSAGNTVATLLGIISSMGFSYYINNFSRYNTLYGSIGTLIILLLWFYINALVLLIGFELNASIRNAKKQHIESQMP
jgi:membrane protein